MSRGRFLTRAVVVCMFWLIARPAAAEERHRPVLSRVVALVAPSHRAVAQAAPLTSPSSFGELGYDAGGYPPHGLGVGPPAFNWGYFGVSYRPMSGCHTGYYDQFVQWGLRRGY